jgi:hypothetical protein
MSVADISAELQHAANLDWEKNNYNTNLAA